MPETDNNKERQRKREGVYYRYQMRGRNSRPD